jgi:plastocyanin
VVPAVGAGGSVGGSEGGGPGSSSGEEVAPPSIPHVQVVAVEYHYTLSRTTVPAGKVALQFVNNGQDEHNLNVLSGEGELEAAFGKTVSHDVRETTVTLRKGSFTLFCSLPEHEAKGMHATLTVQ